MLSELLSNDAVIAGAISFLIAQFLKPFVNFLRVKEWDWVLLVQSGGMPSSHSSMITAVAISIGLWRGFDTGAFAVALAMMMIVTYDAANVRWQSGLHAQRINQLIRGVFSDWAHAEPGVRRHPFGNCHCMYCPFFCRMTG